MKCQLCGNDVALLLWCRHYTRQGIMVCHHCQQQIRQHQHKPYSRVMERLAIVEAGYRINRKTLIR